MHKRNTTFSSNTAAKIINRLSALFFLVIIMLGLVTFMWHWLHNKEKAFSSSNLLAVIMESVIPKYGNQISRTFKWVFFKELGAEVEQGCKGWLFLTDERRLYKDAEKNQQQRLEAVLKIQHALKKKSIQLLVVLVPDKARTHPEKLCHLSYSKLLMSRLKDWAQLLEQKDVQVVNLDEVFQEQAESTLFLATDTHWNEQGAELAAEAITKKIASYNIKPQPSMHYEKSTVNQPYFRGDLLKYSGVDVVPVQLTRNLQEIRAHTSFKVDAADANAEDDLFGDSALPNIVLIGTSYSKNANFVNFLQADLNTSIPNFSVEGGGFWNAAQQYFSSVAFSQTPPVLIIWEIPERMLQAPLDQMEKEWLLDPFP